jgi:hypothetical protein
MFVLQDKFEDIKGGNPTKNGMASCAPEGLAVADPPVNII